MMYADGESFDAFKTAGEAFTPMFEPNYRDDAQRASAENLCGDNLQCKFDFVATNDASVAASTLENANAIESDNANFGKKNIQNKSHKLNCE